METRAVADPRRNSDLKMMTKQFGARARAPLAGLGPALAAAAAVPTQAAHRNLERHRHALARFVSRQAQRRRHRRRTLVGEKRAANTIDRARHRREIDHDVVSKI